MQYLSPSGSNWSMIRQMTQPTQASGPSAAQTPVAQQIYAMPKVQQTGGQTLEELLRLQQQQTQQIQPLGQNYLRQFMQSAASNYFQQLY